LDEAMETLTLVQTGKRNPVPLVLVDEPGGSYWMRWIAFVKDTLFARGYISQSDLKLFERVDSTDDAVQSINHFYARYHSLRYIDDHLVIRLTSGIEQRKVEELKGCFSDILRPDGEMCLSGPLPEEMDEPEIEHLPRLILNFKRDDFGRLRELIDALNND
ncbi:MAG: LOG family protein, partial [Deltaproteobacteria bacterium]